MLRNVLPIAILLPVVTLFSQHMDGASFFFDRPLEASMFAGVRYRL